VISNLCKEYKCEEKEVFHQVTHQFFFEDYARQIAFPRVRNEEDGSITLTVKAKIKDEISTDYFKRVELESVIINEKDIIGMMPYFGFPKKISWEKRRHSFLFNKDVGIIFYLDETPMGWFLEIEVEELKIEEAVKRLNLQNIKRVTKAYLGLWEEFKKEKGLLDEDMMFKK
jgi:adenylate cyclase class IV